MSSKNCKICKTEILTNDELCPYCGCYVRFSKCQKMVLLGLFVWIILPYAIYLAIKDKIRMDKIREQNNIDIKALIFGNQTAETTKSSINTVFVKCSNFRKKDGKIERGECKIDFDKTQFIISQGDNVIENDINSIYYFDTWEYEGDTYYKFRMRSLTEYMFKSNNFEADNISELMRQYGVKIEDNR